MAVHQYIGARYVPYYYENSLDPTSTEWEPNVHYEALTVVTLPNLHSYISKKDVPDTVGSPALNANYWLDTGSDNAYIQNLQDQIDAITGTDLPAIDARIDNIVNVDLPALEAKIEKRNIIVIGNSYVNRGVCDQLMKCFDHAYTYGGDGTGFLTYIHHTTTFEDQLDTAIADTSVDKDTITDIIFVSAMGDERALYERSSAYTADLSAALAAIKTKIDANYPNVQRIVVTLAETRDIAVLGNYKYSDLFEVHRTFKSACPANGFEYIGWSGWIAMFNSTYVEADHFHPTAGVGAEVIGSWLVNAYFGNANYKTFAYNVGAACPFKYTDASTAMIIFDMTPDMVNFNIRRLDCINGAAVTLSGGDQGILDTSGMPVPPPAPAHPGSVNCVVRNIIAGANYGDQVDFLVLGITGDAGGRMTFNNSNNSKMSVMPSNRLSFDQFESFAYIP